VSDPAPPVARVSDARASDEAYEEHYLAYVADSIKQYKRQADRPMRLFVTLRVALIAASALLPVLAAKNLAVMPYVAAGVTALTLLDTHFRWGEEWKHFRRTQLVLQRLKRDYEFRCFALDRGRTVGAVKDRLGNLEALQNAVESLMLAETDEFFRFRITEEKDAHAKQS
jgi:hypothetical protein